MTFEVSSQAYGKFMGRFSSPLAEQFVGLLGIRSGQRVLDVGCGPGALTAALIQRVGPENVSAVDPSESFVRAMLTDFPAIEVKRADAENLPFEDAKFDAVLAQLVVHFMTDPIRGISEMRRVAVPGGLVAASVWDHAGDKGPLSKFWSIVAEYDPSAVDESDLAGAADGHLVELFEAAGLSHVNGSALTVHVEHQRFEDWWDPFTLGVGPAGAYVAGLSTDARAELQDLCLRRLPTGPFTTSATAWVALGRA